MKRSDAIKVESNLLIRLLFIFMIFLIGLTACDQLTGTKDDEPETLHVKFFNDSTSIYTITNIQLMAMGKADDSDVVTDSVWSANILKDGETLAPGEYKFFTLEIPNLHYSIYRLGVDDGEGNEIMIEDQPGYNEDNVFVFTPTITHWGSDDRTVSVHLVYDNTLHLIYIDGYSDFAGIE